MNQQENKDFSFPFVCIKGVSYDSEYSYDKMYIAVATESIWLILQKQFENSTAIHKYETLIGKENTSRMNWIISSNNVQRFKALHSNEH